MAGRQAAVRGLLGCASALLALVCVAPPATAARIRLMHRDGRVTMRSDSYLTTASWEPAPAGAVGARGGGTAVATSASGRRRLTVIVRLSQLQELGQITVAERRADQAPGVARWRSTGGCGVCAEPSSAQ